MTRKVPELDEQFLPFGGPTKITRIIFTSSLRLQFFEKMHNVPRFQIDPCTECEVSERVILQKPLEHNKKSFRW
ncbi:hypothetical protein L596_020339 [Steinernema carpocapsae]|uniref:Uncharacterized protein n=1 Tax=Steinernema carpocapsae TaxID=34508 RepID=A0A4U5MT87_STECR|nr:hypothetical protein L596_020339 [Steinernema carpocapsae]